MLKLKNISYQYQNNAAIKDVSLSLAKGEHISIIGKSGSGKSTLLKLIAGILKSDNIYFKDEPISSITSKIGLVFQENTLFPWLNVEQNLELSFDNQHITNLEIKDRIEKISIELEFSELLTKLPSELSGGENKRVNIAKIILLNPSLILFDEPSSSLDSFTTEVFQKLIFELNASNSIASIVVTHDINEAMLLGEKIIVMENGKIIKTIDSIYYGKFDQKNELAFYQKYLEIRRILF